MPTDPVDEAAEALYGLPPDDFIAERDARAKALRKDGDREAAAAVAKLAKPSRVAAEVNRMARAGELDELLHAGAALRDAQASGDGGALRDATAVERRAVSELVRGVELSADLTERLRTTLHALAGDDELRALAEAGRLAKEAEGGGAWPLGGGGPIAPKPRERTKKRPAARDDQKARKAAEEEKARQEEEQERRKARERLERRLETARARAARAKERLQEAQADYEEAADEVARLEEQLS